MSEAMNSVKAQQFVPPTTTGASTSHAADAATKLPQAPATSAATTYTADPAQTRVIQSKLVQRLVDQKATVYGPGLAQVPLPATDEAIAQPKKPAGPMTTPRDLDGGRSPLAPAPIGDGYASAALLGEAPDAGGESHVVQTAAASAEKMPGRHGLVFFTRTPRGDVGYLTHDRWMHIRENHIVQPPAPRGKRTTTFFPVQYALNSPTMSEADVKAVLAETVQRGVLRNEVRDTRLAEHNLDPERAERWGLRGIKVSMAPDGMLLSGYGTQGDNMLAVREVSPEEQAELASAQAGTSAAVHDGDDRMFRTNVSSTTYG